MLCNKLMGIPVSCDEWFIYTRLLAFCELDPFGTSMLICCIKKQCRVGYQAGKQFFTNDNFIKRDALALFTHRYSASCVYNGLCNARR
jgi:hypothetical protein